MSNEKLLKARHLIDEGKYAQARRMLRGIKDPKAERLLAEIDNLAPAKTSGGAGGGDIIQVLLLGLVFTALFGGIGYVIASGIGIPIREASITVVNTPVPNSGDSTPGAVAVQPTAIPTATTIPCEAQTWWDANRAAFGSAVDTVMTATIQTAGGTINTAKTNFSNWRTTFEGETAAPCVSVARGAMLNAAPGIQAVFDSYLSTTTEQQRAQTFITAMDALLVSANEISELNLDTTQDSWIAAVQNFSNAECPARRWYIESVVARGYAHFFEVFDAIDFNQLSSANNALRELQTLRASFAADSAAFPECIKTVSDHLLATMDGFIGYVNGRLNGDLPGADSQLQAGSNQLGNFYTELGRLDTTLSGVRLR